MHSTPYLTEMDREAYMEALARTYPDPDIVGYLDKLNTIDGVCTVTSCMGWHPGEGGRSYIMGYVELHLSEEKALLLELHATADLHALCDGYASGLVKNWEYCTLTEQIPPCSECEPTDCRHRCRAVVRHTVCFSGRVAMPCLDALVRLLDTTQN